MATLDEERTTKDAPAIPKMTNGAAMAAFLAAGIGSFVLGLVILLNEAGLVTVPALYQPAGGVSGRTTIAVVTWLVAWVVLHARWKDREVRPGLVWVATGVLIALGVLAMFPPFWAVAT